jgi:rfaE bifunctional protein kinase chain/domain
MRIYNSLSAERLNEIIGGFSKLRIGVAGDFFLDKYLEVDPALAEVSLETGKTSHQVVRVRHSPGAAGNVVSNLAALGAGTIHAIGFTGDDGEAYELRKDLAAIGCKTEHLHYDPKRMTPTYLKPRDKNSPGLKAEHNRYDTKNRTETPAGMGKRIIESIETLLPELDALIILDQVDEEGCGVIVSEVVERIAGLAPLYPKAIFWADSRRRINKFRKAIIKPNQFEACGIADPRPDEEIEPKVLEAKISGLRNLTGAPIFATAGRRGMYVSDPELTLIPGVRLKGPLDTTGAGDSVTAACVLSLAAGASPAEAALIGNLVASITVQQLDTTGTARREELPPRLTMYREQQG